MNASAYIGVDGGATYARAVVLADDGRERARRTGPAGLVDPRDPAAAAAIVGQLAREALADAGIDSATVLCCGLAGAGRPHEREAVRVALMFEHVADRVIVVGDAEAAMADAFPEGSGVLAVAGTGSMAWARDRDGVTIRVGGWGLVLGDEGSAYDIGLEGMRRAARAHDGRIPESLLTEALPAAADLRDATDLIAWAASATKAQIAALAPVVLRCAGEGDAAAIGVRGDAVQSIVLLVRTAVRRSGLASPVVALTGGLIAPGGPLRDLVVSALQSTTEQSTILERPVDAALGAARLARASR